MDGKIAVVTGGTQGLGETTARLFAERGAAGLVICGRNIERGEAVAADISARGCKTIFVKTDLGDLDQCRTVIAADRGTILDTSPELFDTMFAVNVRAPFFLIQDAAKIMIREAIKGTIVNIISMSGYGGQSFITAYCASKGALQTLTRNAGYSLMRNQIRVNGLNIGWMDTPGEHSIQTRYHGGDEDWLAKAEAGEPFGRLLKPAEVARTIAFLASDESGMMTGSLVDMDQTVLGCSDVQPQPDQAMTI
jgi:NAD(P)-dependent dehydrogenase (short-subunit alcohol dehydrogenase family)